jgi:protein-S-isoprenylcysteine O-methyltransferase Ste14
MQGAYLALAFGWRSWRQYRTTGDWGFRLSRETEPVARAASGLITAGTVAGFVGAAAGAGPAPRRSAMRVLGLAGMAAAVAGVLRAQLDLGASWRIGVKTDEETALVTTGLFGPVRNPIFSFMALFGVANAVAVPNRATITGAAALVGGIEMQVRLVEEPYLRSVHGAAYDEYMRAAGRFAPRLARGTA